jgi:hypothetical protein
MSLIDEFKAITPSILDSCRLSNDIPTTTTTVTLSGKFMESFKVNDVCVVTAEDCVMRLYRSGVEKSITFPEQVCCCHYTTLGLFVLTSANLYIVDIEKMSFQVVNGFQSVDPVGITGNIGKGMIGVWSNDSLDLYDLADSDDEEMEE